MGWTAPWKHRRHRKLQARDSLRNPRRNRRVLQLEPLEHRALLAGDASPLVGFRLGIADINTLQPISSVHAGDEFALVAYVRDLRPQPEGVFSAYLDVNFPAAQFEVSGQIQNLGGFINAISGAVGSGIADEVGGFAENTHPPGGAEQLVAAIPIIARQAGEFTLTADAADLVVGHEVLLFGRNEPIKASELKFDSLTTTILPGSGSVTHLNANNDEFFVQSSAPLTLDVLANDSSPVPSSMTIFHIDASGAAGQVTVAADHQNISYTPAANFTGVDTFRYSVVDSSAESDTALVTVYVDNSAPTDKKAVFKLLTTDRTGRPITAVNEGDDFLLKVVVDDARANPQGVFAAYVDIAFPPQLARMTGPVEFTGAYTNGITSDTQTPGLIDEAGAFATRLLPQGDGQYLLFQVPMKALHVGKPVFQSGPADLVPDHQSLLFGDNLPLHPNQIGFGQVQLEIRPAVIVVDDSIDIPLGSGPTFIDVLANDQATSTSPLTITNVDTTGLRGTVSVATDGTTLTYAPAANSRGTETFRYTAANAKGNASAQVTIHMQPLDTADDLVQIRLATTDLNGQPLSTIRAGEPFNIQAWVRDLRTSTTGNRGVYATYFDLLYDATRASVAPADGTTRGFDATYGPDFLNGRSGNGTIPGVIDEVGAFQTDRVPLGSGEHLLFTARFQANVGQAGADSFVAQEDTTIEFDVLANDRPNQGTIKFQSDPAENAPLSDVLLFDPAEPVADSAIRYLSTSLNVTGGSIQIADVSASQRGGRVTIINNGHAVRYEPPSDYFGQDEFTYSLGNGNNTVVHVNVLPSNDAPRGAPDKYVANHERPLEVTAATGVLANDSDVDRESLRARLVTGPAHGNLNFHEDGSFTYTPNDNFFGTDHFVYQSFDGRLSSGDTSVEIEVAPPAVKIRLEATDRLGQQVTSIPAGESFQLRAFVQDMRDNSRSDRGIGAAYVDLTFDPTIAHPQLQAANPLGFDVTFGPQYQNFQTGSAATPGLVNDVGALQTLLTPVGRSELQLFSMTFQTSSLRAANDAARVSQNSDVNVIDVLENENGQKFDLRIQSRESGNSPFSDIVLFEPAQAVHGNDVALGEAVVQVQNSSQLVIESVGRSSVGGTITIDSLGRGIRYTPPTNFVGNDTFTYTVRDEHGLRATATVTVTVVESWSNESDSRDVNGDSFVTTNDVLQVINNLNEFGGRKLDDENPDGPYLDVNKDGFVAPIDALILINFLSNQTNGASAEGERVSAATDELLGSANQDDQGLLPLLAPSRLQDQPFSEPTGLSPRENRGRSTPMPPPTNVDEEAPTATRSATSSASMDRSHSDSCDSERFSSAVDEFFADDKLDFLAE